MNFFRTRVKISQYNLREIIKNNNAKMHRDAIRDCYQRYNIIKVKTRNGAISEKTEHYRSEQNPHWIYFLMQLRWDAMSHQDRP